MKSWIKQNNDPETTLALIERYPPAFLLLTQIAQRARRKKALFDDLDIGEAKIGDFKRLGMSENQYRKAKELLEGNGLATFRGTRKGTVAKLCSSNIYDINHEQGDGQSDTKGTDRGRTGDGQGTSNQEGKRGRREEIKEKGLFEIQNPTKEKLKEWTNANGYPQDFLELYELSEKKQDKLAALVHWVKLTEEQRGMVQEQWPKYVKNTDPKYQKLFRTFLDNRGWEDEIKTKANERPSIPGL